MTNLSPKIEIINDFLKELSGRAYLEIGVRNGQNFFSIECSHKYGVDPEFFSRKDFF